MKYQIALSKKARTIYLALAEKIRNNLCEKLLHLAENPFASNHNVKPLHGMHGCYRLRMGDWRIIYSIEHHHAKTNVIKIAHRKEAYQ